MALWTPPLPGGFQPGMELSVLAAGEGSGTLILYVCILEVNASG
ncbi:MAG: hypothetical protein WKF67_14740 [Rubrobacteraceae bacterium]